MIDDSVDELTYEWPRNILRYETKFWGGLTITNLFAMAIPFMTLTFAFSKGEHQVMGMVLGLVAALIGLLMTKRFETLGGLILPVYLYRLTSVRQKKPRVEMPLIMPLGTEQFIIETWEGETLMELGGD